MIAKLLLLAKAAATSAIKNAVFVKEFQVSDWTGGNVLTVSASEHGRGTKPSADVWRLVGSAYVKSEGFPSDGWTLTADASGNLTLTTEAGKAFSGRIIVL